MKKILSVIRKKAKIFIGVVVIISMISGDGYAILQGQDKNSAEFFDKIAQTIFKPIYPLLALQIKQDYGITRGICIDVGGGSGNLAIELAKITDLEVISLDIDPKATEIAQRYIAASGLSGRVKAITADVQNMPFADDSADLIVSRASYMFWPDKVRAFREILRILKPGGSAFVGSGFGNLLPEEARKHIQDVLAEKNIGPPPESLLNFEEMAKILRKAGIWDFRITTDTGCLCGLWVDFKKPAPRKKKL
jgi:ubiquinone/menaquinone biosynthesis C-methylase UbiE